MGAIVAIAAGGHHSVALAADGTVWAWGLATVSQAQRAPGTPTPAPVPVRVAGLVNIQAIADGGLHALALRADGTTS